jgi:hypothetical protein
MARQFGLKPLSVTRPSGPQPKAIPALRIVSEAKQSVQRQKPLYAPCELARGIAPAFYVRRSLRRLSRSARHALVINRIFTITVHDVP